MKLTPGKLRGMEALADKRGVIAAAAMDQRGSLKKMLQAAGVNPTPEMMAEFKTAVTRILTSHASAILLDPEYGLEAARQRAKNAGLLLAYEKSGYDNTRPGRLPDFLEHWSALRLKEAGADAVKVLIHYTPFEDEEVNDEKKVWIERIGAECVASDIPFFLELVGYDPAARGGSEKTPEFAKIKPEVVARSMDEFSKDRYQVDVLKVEIPVNLQYVEGTRSFKGPAVSSRQQALEHYRAAAAAARRPFIYLSAGVSNAQFIESLEMAAEAGVKFNGVLCGRATWADGVPEYARGGLKALEVWLSDQGVKNIKAMNEALKNAAPWYAAYGVQSPAALVA
jgi:tagatose 1,6-diphosphate aldolase